MSKEITDAYDELYNKYIDKYEGDDDVPEIKEIHDKMDALWKQMSFTEKQQYFLKDTPTLVHDLSKSTTNHWKYYNTSESRWISL